METTKIQRVVDELEILRLLATLAQAIDDRDEVRYRACLADEVMGASPLWRPELLARGAEPRVRQPLDRCGERHDVDPSQAVQSCRRPDG